MTSFPVSPTVKVHVDEVPEQVPPAQPVNREPEVAVAVSVSDVPERKYATHVPSHEIPAGLDVTVPDPTVPEAIDTPCETLTAASTVEKVAAAVLFAVIVSRQVFALVDVQGVEPQPAKT